MIKRLIGLFKPYKKESLLVILMMIASVVVTMFIPIISKTIIDKGLMNKNIKVVVILSSVYFIAVFLHHGMYLGCGKYLVYINTMIKYRLNSKVLKKLFNKKTEYFDKIKSAEIIKNTSMDIDNICRISDESTIFVITEILRLIGGIVGLLIIDLNITFLILGSIPIKYMIIKYMAKKRRNTYKSYMEYSRDYHSWYGDTISGMKEIKLWAMDSVKKKEFNKKQRKIVRTEIKLAMFDRVNQSSDSLLFELLTCCIYVLGGVLILNNDLTLGSLMASVTYTMYVTGPVSTVLNIGYLFSSILPSAHRLFEFLDSDTEENSIKNKELRNLSQFNGDIQFKNVSFTYNNEKNVLSNINISINRGEKIVIVGDNGSGKSTFIKVMLGLYKPNDGEILLDNYNISELKLKEYRKNYSVVSQEVYMFDATIKENISLFSNITDEEIVKAAKASGAHEFIEELPQKYDTELGRYGIKLSGGQAQRVAIARALAKKSKILIFDEATSNCDVKSQEFIKEMLKQKFQDKTIIIITHKLDIEVLEHADKVVMLENGVIKELGRHEELYENSEIYKEVLKVSGIGV